ncbi:hypothetical protein HZS_2850 [Henneguya salminicola]|nr:hypothetical protein HZS_2850 [Henneguya salminicola]
MSEEIIKQGWIQKKGEIIKNWRSRYYHLNADGLFIGYKDENNLNSVLNKFCVRSYFNYIIINSDSIIKTDEQNLNFFSIRFLKNNTFIERLFRCKDQEERDEWIEALQKIKQIHGRTQSRTESDLNLEIEEPDE